MAKAKSVYACTECGYETGKWLGQCPGCREWNTMEEKLVLPEAAPSRSVSAAGTVSRAVRLAEINTADDPRYNTGMTELDRVLGGGLVKGSVVLLGGDPGIGKSTLLLQICEHLGRSLDILYVSGEESVRQLKLRATRLGVDSARLLVLSETDCMSVVESINQHKPDLVIIDSIQTMNIHELNSAPGSMVQVRECTNLLTRTAKGLEIPVFLVGHVTKDGNIAGPKTLEHMVDAVLYFEGDRNLSYRILRAVKNRFGSTNEIGVFEMAGDGLREVENPSQLLLSGRPLNVPGTCVACVMEGTRPILAEVQGLVMRTAYGTPRRMSTGFDNNRVALLLAVLEKRAGFAFSGGDTYVNVVGGLRLDEPAADLPVALSLVSSLRDLPVNEGVVAFGEVGLAGELRSVTNAEGRVREAARLGMTKCILPKQCLRSLNKIADPGIQLIGVKTVKEAVEALGG
ncbi:MAG: DNA repair protein RadA [Ruminococcaceae bacterium]|nr:DNA repair protein RadA [Oscillospiraceae bacterium]